MLIPVVLPPGLTSERTHIEGTFCGRRATRKSYYLRLSPPRILARKRKRGCASCLGALRNAGCEVIRSEKRSGTTTEGRAELQTVLEFLRKGDVLMVTRIDRLARSIGDLQDIVRMIRARGASLRATEPAPAFR
jgi:DNA invertase Pin-like site-specific DNA recombinase